MTSEEGVSYLTLLRNRDFRRFFAAQLISSLGDWVGVFAIVVLARKLDGDAAVGVVMAARVLPGFFVGPIAGVIADRYDRKRTMVIADIIRAGLIFSLPFVPHLWYLLLASIALESLTLIWGPAKDASLPHFVKQSHLVHANSLSLIAIYGPWPLASIVYASLSTFGGFLGRSVPALSGLTDNTEALALWMDSFTFLFSALMISTVAIPASIQRAGSFRVRQIKDDLVEGLSFVIRHKQVRPWLLGIALTFTAAGAVFSLGYGFVRTALGAGDRGFAFLVGFLGAGMIIGLLAVGLLAKKVQKDVLFSGSILLLGVGLATLATMNSLDTAIPIASALGFFGGIAYSTGYSLVHETTSDELRGRTFSAGYTVIRIGTLLGLGVFPLIAGAIDSTGIDIPGTRVTLWVAAAVALAGGIASMRAIRHRSLGAVVSPMPDRGYFVVFEGGEGAGKTTQMEALRKWLQARGEDVVVTREPGGTDIGNSIRELLLDPQSASMDPRAEALLYAADRAQHVAEVIKPALAAGRTVISDRFIDSSLAYQGLARGLGLDEIYRLSEWATGGLLPDLVFFLMLEPEEGLSRLRRDRDRLELEEDAFHRRVLDGYLHLARRFPGRFIVLDATSSPGDLHRQIIEAIDERRSGAVVDLRSSSRDLGRPGPIPR